MMLTSGGQPTARDKGPAGKPSKTRAAVLVWTCCRCGDSGMTTFIVVCSACGHWRCRLRCWVEYCLLPKCEKTEQSYSRADRGLQHEALQPFGPEPQTLTAYTSSSFGHPANAHGYPFPATSCPTSFTNVHSYPSSAAGGNKLPELEPLTIDPHQLLAAAISLPTNQSSAAQVLDATPPHNTNPWPLGTACAEYDGPEDIPSPAAFLSSDGSEEAFSPGFRTAQQFSTFGEPEVPLVPIGPEVCRTTGSPAAQIASQLNGYHEAAVESGDTPPPQQHWMFACPFWKQNPQLHPKCIIGYKRIRDVKQHLRRRHSQCPRCGKLFDSEKKYTTHLQLRRQCKLDTIDPSRGISPKQIRELAAPVNGQNEENEQWVEVWDIVFPQKARPQSPYAYNGTSEDLAAYCQFLFKHGPGIILKSVEATGLNETTLESTLRATYDSWFAQKERTIAQVESQNDEKGLQTYSPTTPHRLDDMSAGLINESQAVDDLAFDPTDPTGTCAFQVLGYDAAELASTEYIPMDAASWLSQFDYPGSALVEPSQSSWPAYWAAASEPIQ